MNKTLEEIHSLEKIYKSKGIAVVDVWAEWCVPCKLYSKVLEDINEFKIFSLEESEKTGRILNEYKCRTLPTLLVFKDGQYIGKTEGFSPKERTIEKVRELIAQ